MENVSTIRKLNALTRSFYASVAPSFSATRQQPWQGWTEALPCFEMAMALPNPSILDVGCGNGRLKRFLQDHYPDTPFSYHGLDYSTELAAEGGLSADEFTEVDLVGVFLDGGVAAAFPKDTYDLVCAFGLMHHVPSEHLRLRIIASLVHTLKPGGIGMISFWQFMNDPRLAKKAEDSTVEALAAGAVTEDMLSYHDYLLGWQDTRDVFRYCHHFDDSELLRLTYPFSVDASMLAVFRADGKADDLNCYIVFQRLFNS